MCHIENVVSLGERRKGGVCMIKASNVLSGQQTAKPVLADTHVKSPGQHGVQLSSLPIVEQDEREDGHEPLLRFA